MPVSKGALARLASLAVLLGGLWLVFSMAGGIAGDQLKQLFPQLNGGHSIDALGELVRLLPVMVFGTTICVLWGIKLFSRPESAAETTSRPHPNTGSIIWPVAWGAGSALLFSLIAGAIVLADPNGLYGTKLYQPLYLCTRDQKVTSYLALPQPPDVLILGSSRAFTMSPSHIRATLGYSAFNASTGGSSTEDLLIMARYLFDHSTPNPPKVLLAEVGPTLSVSAAFTAFCTPLYMLSDMSVSTASMAIQDRVGGLLDARQLADSLYSMRYHQLYGPPDVFWKFDPLDGQGVASKTKGLQAEITAEIAASKPIYAGHPPCNETDPCAMDPQGARYAEDLVALARERNAAVIFYVPPVHPRYYDAVLRDDPFWQAGERALADYMQNLRNRNDNVYFLDYSRVESFDGLTTAKGFYDYEHLTEENANRIIDAAANTIRQAYQWAESRRQP